MGDDSFNYQILNKLPTKVPPVGLEGKTHLIERRIFGCLFWKQCTDIWCDQKKRCCVFLLAGGRQLIFRELSGRQLSCCWCIVIAVCAAERAERSIKDPSQLLPCHSAGRFIIAIIINIYGIFCQPPQSHFILPPFSAQSIGRIFVKIDSIDSYESVLPFCF